LKLVDKKYYFLIFGIFLILFNKGTTAFSAEIKLTKFENVEGAPSYFKLSVDGNIHNDYGLTYPVTYQFSISSGSSNLKAYKKYTEYGIWIQIPEKTDSDFFNGIEAVKFNYTNDKAYISIAFNEASNNIFLKIIDESGNSIDVTYDKITKYYDNRDAAVVFSADDWCGNSFIDSKFQQACDMFTSKKIWLSVGIITQGFNNDERWGKQPPPVWSHIQDKIDKGYIEPNSHSRIHLHIPYDDYDSEIGGSKEDIINNLNLPSLYNSGTYEYVWCWISPYCSYDETLYSKLGEYKYIAGVSGPMDNQEGDFPKWDSNNGLYEKWNRWSYIECKSLSKLNNEFDKRINTGKIYHIGFHPWKLDFSPGSKIDQHTDYVKGRKDLWYVGQGALMVYHYVEDQNIVTIQEKYREGKLSDVFCYPNPCYPTKGQVVKIVNLPSNVEKICIYNIAGELVKSLEKGDGITEGTGITTANWDCRNDSGQEVSRGVYVYLILTVNGEKKVGKVAMIK